MTQDAWIVFLLLVFGTGFLLSQVLLTSTFGENRKARRRIRQRIAAVASEDDARAVSLLRREFLQSLSPWEAWIESLPGTEGIRRSLLQAGKQAPAYRIVLRSVLCFLVAGIGVGAYTMQPLYGLLAGAVLCPLPFMVLAQQRRQRLARFEEQLPEALDTMSRALRAGHPYSATLKLVAEEMAPPVSDEFGIMFSETNFGGDQRRTLLNLLDRIPSVTVMAFVTAVLIQRESGGNLADILGKLAKSVRQRFRFQRTLATLSAQGRLSAWILTLEPFVLFAILWVVAPGYIEIMVVDPRGHMMLGAAFALVIAGVFWIRHVIKIEV